MSACAFPNIACAKAVQIDFTNPAPEAVLETIQDTLPEFVNAETPIQARRQGRRAKTAIKDVLNSYGYYNPNIDVSETGVEGVPQAVLTVDAGPLFRLDKIQFKFSDPQPRTEDIETLQRQLPIGTGDPAIPSNIIDAERILTAGLRSMGYAFAEVTGRDVIGDKDAATLGVRYTINSGARVRIGDVTYPKNIRTKERYLARLDPTKIGELYDPASLALYNSRLSETRLFNTSLALLSSDPVRSTPEGDAVHDIVLEIEERPRYSIAVGANYGTDEGFGVNVELTRRNVTRRGDLLIADARAAQRELGLNLTWRRPNALGYGKGLVLTAAALDENTDAFNQQLLKLGAGYEVVKSQKLNYNFGVRGQYIREKDSAATHDYQTLAAYAGVNIDRSDSVLDPRKGWKAEARVVPTYAIGGTSNKAYLRAVTQGRAYLPVDAKARLVIAGRMRAGFLFGADAADVPGDDRFYAGGGGSVRGYGYQAIGPFDVDDNPVGGRSLLDASVEARWRYNDKIGIVGFIDAGNTSDELYPDFSDLKIGAGIGARYMTPAGPVRVDLAVPLNPSDRDEDFQIYISIGQAF